MPRTFISWAALAGPVKKRSCQFCQFEPTIHLQALLREREEFIGRVKIFSMKKSCQCAAYFNTPQPSPGEGTEVLSSLGKMRSLSMGASENHLSTSQWASNCAPANTESPDVKLQYQARSLLILDPWPSSPPPPTLWLQQLKEGWGELKVEIKPITHLSSPVPVPRPRAAWGGDGRSFKLGESFKLDFKCLNWILILHWIDIFNTWEKTVCLSSESG